MNPKIKDLIKREYGRKLTYVPIKTKDDFLNNYKMHDKALQFLIPKIIDSGINITPLGKDLRETRVIMKNEIPDFYAETKKSEFAFDIKSKSLTDFFGWINKRAVQGYRNFTNKTDLDVYAFFVLVKSGKVEEKYGYSNILDKELKIIKAWDGNIVYIFKWEEGLPFSS